MDVAAIISTCCLFAVVSGWTYMAPQSIQETESASRVVVPACGPWMCSWGPWSKWSDCRPVDTRCIFGSKRRTRSIVRPENCPKLKCGGLGSQHKFCKPTCETKPEDCGENMEYSKCAGCDPTCDTQDTARRCTLNCRAGCTCKKGFVRNAANKCVTKDQCEDTDTPTCGDNERYSKCGSKCNERTCKERSGFKICPAVCDQGCFCLPGFVRNKDKQCVRPSECETNTKCEGENEVFSACSKHCDNRCTDIGPKICTFKCEAGCICKKGYSRNSKNQCILSSKCENRCKPNEVFQNCRGCDGRCDNVKYKFCPMKLICLPGCSCKPGFVRDHRYICIAKDQCPKPQECPENEVFKRCKWCDQSCDTNNRFKCTMQCSPGCQCKTGYARNSKGKCILRKDCPKPECPKNEAYYECGSGCGDPKCGEEPGKNKICPTVCYVGCMCKKGYVRSWLEQCVLPNQCDQGSVCGENEEWRRCGSSCGDKKCTDVGKKSIMRVCTLQCKRGCFCKKGYVRNDKKTCVLEDDCTTGKELLEP